MHALKLLANKEIHKIISIFPQQYNIPKHCQAENRKKTVFEITRGLGLNFPEHTVREFINEATPKTIGPQRILRVIATEYENMCKTFNSWEGKSHEEILYYFAIQLTPSRYSYGFNQEQKLRELCQWTFNIFNYKTLRFAYRANAKDIMTQEQQNTIAIAIIFLILLNCFRLLPILPQLDLSPIVKAIRGYDSDYNGFIEAMHQVMANAEQSSRQQSPIDVPPMLEAVMNLLADGEARSLKEIMQELGISQRPKISDSLQFALNELLIVTTEKKSNSPRQKYRIEGAGHQYLQIPGSKK